MHTLHRWMLLTILSACASAAHAQGCDNRLVVFGDSLTDPGNAYAALGVISIPPYSLIPSAPYASHTFSNGPTWAERLAVELESPDSGAPAFVGPGAFTNYAVGGARARPNTGAYDLTAEVSLFLANYAGHACSKPTYVLWIGGDDLRDALTELATAPDPLAGQADATAIIANAIIGIVDNVVSLAVSGARNFLILDAPDISRAPAVRLAGPGAVTAGATLSAAFNQSLAGAVGQLQGLPGVKIARYDGNALVAAIVADPLEFGLRDAVDPCLRFGVLEDAVCAKPNQYLFWDGIHPTAAGQRIFARAVRKSALVAASKYLR